MDTKLRQLNLLQYSTAIKACASDISTLPFVTVDDLICCRVGGKVLNKAQAKHVVRKLQQPSPKKGLDVKELQEQISGIDKKLQSLGISEYASVIKACASDASTLPFVTIDDLMSNDNSSRPLTKAQARLVVERCTPKKSRVIKSLSEKNSQANKITPSKNIAIKLNSKKEIAFKPSPKINIVKFTPNKTLRTVIPKKKNNHHTPTICFI